MHVSSEEEVEQDNVEEPIVEINAENNEDQDTTLEEGTSVNTENPNQNTGDTETHENLEQVMSLVIVFKNVFRSGIILQDNIVSG